VQSTLELPQPRSDLVPTGAGLVHSSRANGFGSVSRQFELDFRSRLVPKEMQLAVSQPIDVARIQVLVQVGVWEITNADASTVPR
jgi:hypothetical protein